MLFLLGDHRLEQRVALVDDVVAEHDDERFLADVLGRHEHRMAEPGRDALAYEMDLGQLGRSADPGQPLEVALLLQRRLDLGSAVEVVLDRALAAAGDDEDVGQAGAGRLFDDVFESGLVDDRQQLLRNGLGGGKETGAESRSGDDSLSDGHVGRLIGMDDQDGESRAPGEAACRAPGTYRRRRGRRGCR